MFDSAYGILAVCIGASLISLRLVARIRRQVKRRKEELEAQLLRECPELEEIVASRLDGESGFQEKPQYARARSAPEATELKSVTAFGIPHMD